MISRLPLLNRVLLGEDENLINAYFALSGPLGEPEARLIPVKTLSAGPASFMLEGFPAFVRGGLSRLRSMLVPGSEGIDWYETLMSVALGKLPAVSRDLRFRLRSGKEITVDVVITPLQ